MDSPDLIIPVRIDPSKATAALKVLGPAGKKAGDDVAAGAAHATEGLGKAKAGADSFGSSMASLMKAQAALSLVKTTAMAIGSAFNDTAKYVQEMAKEFQGLRKSMQEVATLKGSANTNQFTIKEAEAGQAAHLSPQEYRDFQAQFLNYAGSQIGGANGKLTETQGQEYAARVAELMKGSGVNPAVGAELAGSLLENSKGPQNVDALMQKLGRTFNVLEKGRVPLAGALPQISQIMAHGISAEESAKLFSIASPAAPGQEGNAVESALKAIEEMKVAGTGKAFGVERGMSDYASIKAFAENLNKRKQDMIAAGKTEQEAVDEVAAQLKKADVAAEIRERRGLVRGFGRLGIELGGFKTFEDIEKNTPADFEAARKKRYEESSQGRQDAVDNSLAVEQAKLGERNDAVAKWRKIAETELTTNGTFETVNPGAELVGRLAGSDARTLQINQKSIRMARAQLGERGDFDNMAAVNQGLTDQLLRELLKRLESIDENTRKANAQRMAAPGVPNALVPPQPAGRVGGG